MRQSNSAALQLQNSKFIVREQNTKQTSIAHLFFTDTHTYTQCLSQNSPLLTTGALRWAGSNFFSLSTFRLAILATALAFRLSASVWCSSSDSSLSDSWRERRDVIWQTYRMEWAATHEIVFLFQISRYCYKGENRLSKEYISWGITCTTWLYSFQQWWKVTSLPQ